MNEPFARTTLHQQLVNSLRRGIEEGRWSGELPSEAEFCRDYQISRMTLRKALAQLAAEEWITLGGRGRRHHVRARAAKSPVTNGRIIRLLSPFPVSQHGSSAIAIFEALQQWVVKTGYVLEPVPHQGVFQRFNAAKLQRIDALPDTAAWLCCYGTEAIHRWLAESGRPTVVLGRVHGDLPLSNVFPESSASSRHAAGQLYRCGHRKLAYLISNPTGLGDQLASEAFVREAERLGANARIYRHESNPASIGRMMVTLFSRRPWPTGLLVGSPEGAITVLCHLLARGIRVPQEVGLVAMWDDANLDWTYPSIARYRSNGPRMGRLIGKTLQELIRHGTGKVWSYPIMPDFVPGGSLSPVTR